MHDYTDYHEAGMRFFGLYGVQDGICECGDKDCDSFFKHPRVSRWQYTPEWSKNQIEGMEMTGQLKTGWGIIVDGYLIIDVDARNGGVKSFEKLLDKYPDLEDQCGFVVLTGSGGGSKHLYFKMPSKMALLQSHDDYKGIDFKTSGFVVGSGSVHASGCLYETEKGSPQEITEAPEYMIDLLKRPDRHRGFVDGQAVDVSDEELTNMLEHIPNHDEDYELWIRIGMAIHEATQGSGFDLWVYWSSKSKKHDDRMMDKKWHSFGKSANPVTLGTIVHHAKENGYIDPVEFAPSAEISMPVEANDYSEVDLLRPVGFVGELTRWINSQCLYPRESLAVAAALQAVSNIGGMRYYDQLDGMTPNLILFCVAGSGTGKEAIAKAFAEIMKAADLSSALYGSFKSEQELYRNLLRHQAAYYSIDEMGIHLSKIKNATTRGGASYLEGLIGSIMSAFTKADSFMPITGDLKEQIREQLSRELSSIEKKLDEATGSAQFLEQRSKSVQRQLEHIEQGIESPFLSIIGYTTPTTFDALFDFEQATNGFLSRAMIFRELDTNPNRKENFSKLKMPEKMRAALQNIYNRGAYDTQQGQRIEYLGDKVAIPTTAEAKIMLDKVYEDFWNMAEEHKGQTGLEAIPRRGYEMAAKVSLTLAIPEGLRTEEHVRWAAALAKRDVEGKLALANSNSAATTLDQVASKIMSSIDHDKFETIGVIRNRCRKFTQKEIDATIEKLVEKGYIVQVEEQHKTKKSVKTLKYKRAKP